MGPEEDLVTDTNGGAPALTFDDLVTDYLEDYELHGYRAIKSAKSRVAQFRRVFGAVSVDASARPLGPSTARRPRCDACSGSPCSCVPWASSSSA